MRYIHSIIKLVIRNSHFDLYYLYSSTKGYTICMSMHLGKSICDHFLTMYSNVLHNTTVHSMPLSELSDNFSDHKKIPQPRALSRFCRVKIIRRSVLVHQSYQNLLILQGFQHFPLFFYTVFTRFSKLSYFLP